MACYTQRATETLDAKIEENLDGGAEDLEVQRIQFSGRGLGLLGALAPTYFALIHLTAEKSGGLRSWPARRPQVIL